LPRWTVRCALTVIGATVTGMLVGAGTGAAIGQFLVPGGPTVMTVAIFLGFSVIGTIGGVSSGMAICGNEDS